MLAAVGRHRTRRRSWSWATARPTSGLARWSPGWTACVTSGSRWRGSTSPNRALEEARGEWIAFVDDDVRVDRYWLDGFAAALVEHPDAAALTGLVLPAELQTDAQLRFERRGGFGRGYEQRRWDGRHGPGNRLHPLGGGSSARAATWLRRRCDALGGGFDEALGTGPPLPGGGDLDAFYRVLDAGHVLVYEPRMAVFHRHRRGWTNCAGSTPPGGRGSPRFWARAGATRGNVANRPDGRVVAALPATAVGRRRARAQPRGRPIGLGGVGGGVTGLPFGYRGRAGAWPSAGRTPEHQPTRPDSRGPDERRREAAMTRTDAVGASGGADASPALRSVDLREGLPSLADRDGLVHRWYLWWGSRPLGMLQVEPWQLPVSDARLARLVAAASVPRRRRSAVSGHGLRRGVAGRSSAGGGTGVAPGPPRSGGARRSGRRGESPGTACGRSGHGRGGVVCTRDRPEQLRRCLRAVRALDRRPDELVVVDNAPRDDSTRRVAEEEGAVYVLEPRPGLSHARNAGIAATSADVIAFTDDDAVVHPGWLGRLLAGFRSPDVMAVTGLVLPGALDTEAHRVFEDVVGGFGQGFRAWEVGPDGSTGIAGAPLTCGASERARAWRSAGRRSTASAASTRGSARGPQAAARIRSCGTRLLAGGWRCRYEPWAVAYHYHRDNLPELRRQAYRYMRGHVAALAVQWNHTRQVGEPAAGAGTLPRYYLGRGLRRLWWQADDPTLGADVLGYLAGLLRVPAMVRAAPPAVVPTVPARRPDRSGRGRRRGGEGAAESVRRVEPVRPPPDARPVLRREDAGDPCRESRARCRPGRRGRRRPERVGRGAVPRRRCAHRGPGCVVRPPFGPVRRARHRQGAAQTLRRR